MNEDDFEQRLRRLPRREVPGEWREEILSASGAPVSDPARFQAVAKSSTRRAGGRRSETPWWLAWLVPGRAGLATLGTAWLLILGLHLAASSHAASDRAASATVAKLPEPWLEQRRLLAELLELPADLAPPPTATRPRSERRAQPVFLCA
ncbi:MAG TPA: hypothetical protein VI454_13505 [Verrucomicrobiae bacterium]|jgi:hypothetical protein